MLKEIDKMEKQDFNDFDPQGLIFQVLQKTSIIIWHVFCMVLIIEKTGSIEREFKFIYEVALKQV